MENGLSVWGMKLFYGEFHKKFLSFIESTLSLSTDANGRLICEAKRASHGSFINLPGKLSLEKFNENYRNSN
jgi:hypothetical protein